MGYFPGAYTCWLHLLQHHAHYWTRVTVTCSAPLQMQKPSRHCRLRIAPARAQAQAQAEAPLAPVEQKPSRCMCCAVSRAYIYTCSTYNCITSLMLIRKLMVTSKLCKWPSSGKYFQDLAVSNTLSAISTALVWTS